MKRIKDSAQLSLFDIEPANEIKIDRKRVRKGDASSYPAQLDLFHHVDGFKNPDGEPDRGSSFYSKYLKSSTSIRYISSFTFFVLVLICANKSRRSAAFSISAYFLICIRPELGVRNGA